MSRILVSNEIFNPVDPESLYEPTFENLVLQHSETIFPGFITIPFKLMITSPDYGNTKADLALIDLDFRQWCVVEVELVSHSLFGHIIPQAKKLRDGIYPVDIADYISKQDARLNADRVRVMLKGDRPRILLLANGLDKDWIEPLRKLDVSLMVIELFRSASLKPAFRCTGGVPPILSSQVSLVDFVPLLSGVLRVRSPAALGARDGEILTIYRGEFTSEWKVSEFEQHVWLIPKHKGVLDTSCKYRIVRDEKQLLAFEQVI